MKKVISVVLTMVMLLSMWTLFVNAADPALEITPTMLAAPGNMYLNDVSAQVAEEGGVVFARFTTADSSNGDPWVWFQPVPSTTKENQYAAIRYRSTFSGSASIYAKVAEPHADFVLNGDGEWHTAVVDLSACGANWTGEFNRLDVQNGKGGYVDYAGIALFPDSDSAAKYTGPSDQIQRVNSYTADGGVGTWVGNGAGRVPAAGVAFNAAAPFIGFGVPQFWGNDGSGVIEVNLYAYDTDFATAIAGTPLYTTDFTYTGNGGEIQFSIGKAMAPGKYAIAFEAKTETGYFVLPNNSSSYGSNVLEFSPSAFGFFVNFVKSDVESYFDKLISDRMDTVGGNLCPQGSTPVNLKDGDIAVRVTVPEGYLLRSVTGLASPTYTETENCNAVAKIYAWDTDYDTTVAGNVLATAEEKNHVDNQNMPFVFDNPVRGDLLIVFSASGTGSVGFWCGNGKGVAAATFFNGQENTDKFPGTDYELYVSGETKVGFDRLYINNDTLSFDESLNHASDATVVINAGDKLNILGWAANSISGLKRIYWTLDGAEKACSDTYRARTDLKDHTGFGVKYLQNSGFGLDNDLMELTGVSELPAKTTATVQIIAEFENSYKQVLKEFKLVVAGKLQNSLDALSVNVNEYLKVENNLKDEKSITITSGDKLYILGWAAKYGTNLDKVFWQYIAKPDQKFEDGAEIVTMDCSDTYRDRAVIADATGILPEYLTKSGYGTDENMMELLGADALAPGSYTVRIRALLEDGTDGVVKSRFNLIVEEKKPQKEFKEGSSRDQVTVDGADKALVGGNAEVTEISEDLKDLIGKQIRFWGWYGNNEALDKYGLVLDGGEMKYYDRYEDAGIVAHLKGVFEEDEVYASRFEILTDITPGSHTAEIYAIYGDKQVLVWTVKYNATDETQPATEEQPLSIEASVNEEGKLVIKVTGKFGEKDWVGVYRKGEVPGTEGTSSLVWFYVGTEGGEFVLPFDGMQVNDRDSVMDENGVVKPGAFDIYVLANDGYTPVTDLAPATVEVAEPQPQTDEPQPQTQPQTGDAVIAMIAIIAVLAMGAAVVFSRKRSF